MEEKMKNVIWTAKQLFDRGLVTGSTGNISFRDGDYVYISQSGGCFGTLDEKSFAKLTLSGKVIEGKPSKEYPLHLTLYNISEENQAIIHTHSFFTTLVSCLKAKKAAIDGLFAYTPYLKMKTNGNIKTVSYQKPGSKELFSELSLAADEDTQVYILSNHGGVVAAKNIMDAFFLVEELEESAKILCNIQRYTPNSFKEILDM